MSAFLVAWFDSAGWHSQAFSLEVEARAFGSSVSGFLLCADSDAFEWSFDAPVFGQLQPLCGGTL